MSTSEDIVIVESSDYAQVVFNDVKEMYSHAKPLECTFTLNELLKCEESNDWIGIYKVGFSNCDEYISYLPVDIKTVTENKGNVTFNVEDLPKDDGEFYQFVFVSNGKQIRGASVPFQFNLNECTEFSDDEDKDAVVIKFEGNETITDIKTQCNQITNANETYEKLIRENEALIKTLKDEVASIKLRCFRLTMDNEKLNFTLRSKADSLKNLAETISSLTNDNNNLQEKFNDLSVDNKNLLESLQERIGQVASLKNELESVKMSKNDVENVLISKEKEMTQLEKDKNELKRIAEELILINEQIVRLENQVLERNQELDQIKSDLRKNNTIVNEQAETIQTMADEKATLNELVKTLTNDKEQLENNQQIMEEELRMSKDKINAAEQCKEMLYNQLKNLTDELEETKKKMSIHYNVSNDLTDRLAQIEFEKATNDEKIAHIKAEYEEKLNQVTGSMYVLKVAHNSLETRLKSSEQRREKEYTMNKKTIDELKQENEELKERIRYGALEYTKIFEKCRLLKNQKFNSEMNQHENRNQLNSTSTDKSAIKENTKLSAQDSENTLLDAFLGSSFYNNTWTGNMQTDKSSSAKKNTFSEPESAIATTIQPKSSNNQENELSDDGLVNQKKNQQAFQENNNDKNIKTNNLNCEICDFIFPTGVTHAEREQHYAIHYGPTCPVCYLQFNKEYSQQNYEDHVNSHFSN